VLFFCAFMTATMANMVIDSLQTLLSPPEEPLAGPGAEDALRRLLEENPRLRWGYLPWSRPSIDSLVADYGGGSAATEEESSEQSLATVLMVACVLVKLLCFIYCKAVARRSQSGVVAALADDHRNDAVSNLFAAVTMIVIRVLEDRGVSEVYLTKIDPGVALLLSTWIVKNWVSSAVEQLQKLSDEVVDDEESQRIQSAAEDALRGSSLRVDATHVYSVGDGCRVSLELAPIEGDAASQRVASSLGKLDNVVREASKGVQEVDWRLRPQRSHEWVREYAKP
jgi:divalent metal cation (Fe/Co/Zn/Cd) transporter